MSSCSESEGHATAKALSKPCEQGNDYVETILSS